jgi:hypothetical protein
MIFGSYQEVGTVSRVVGVGSDVARVILENSLGDVRIEAGRPGIVEIFARFKAPGGEAHEVTDSDVEVTSGDGKLKIKPAEPPKTLSRRKVCFEVRVPMTMDVRVRSGVGNVEVRGLNGEHDLRAGVGNITVTAERICGKSRFRAGTGKLDISAHRIEGDPGLLAGVGNIALSCGTAMLTHASLKCATGNIRLGLPPTFVGGLDFKAGVGRIDMGPDRQTIPVHAAIVGSRAAGRLGQGPGEIEARTAVGSIVLTRTQPRPEGRGS